MQFNPRMPHNWKTTHASKLSLYWDLVKCDAVWYCKRVLDLPWWPGASFALFGLWGGRSPREQTTTESNSVRSPTSYIRLLRVLRTAEVLPASPGACPACPACPGACLTLPGPLADPGRMPTKQTTTLCQPSSNVNSSTSRVSFSSRVQI